MSCWHFFSFYFSCFIYNFMFYFHVLFIIHCQYSMTPYLLLDSENKLLLMTSFLTRILINRHEYTGMSAWNILSFTICTCRTCRIYHRIPRIIISGTKTIYDLCLSQKQTTKSLPTIQSAQGEIYPWVYVWDTWPSVGVMIMDISARTGGRTGDADVMSYSGGEAEVWLGSWSTIWRWITTRLSWDE